MTRTRRSPGWLVLLLTLAVTPAAAVELQGHRGARGLLPENTLAGMREALAIGVHTLELDLALTADGVLVLSHDPLLNPALTRDREGRWLARPGPAIRRLRHAQLAGYDVGRLDPGSRYARRFPDQHPVDGTRIPTLASVFELVRGLGVELNIEIKTSPESPGHTAAPEVFADAVVAAVQGSGMASRVTVQSFDWRTLQRVQERAPSLRTSYLSAEQRWLDNVQRGRPGASPWAAGLDVDDHGGSLPRLVHAAGGAIWSPYHREVDAARIGEAHALGLEVIVWTVNDPAEVPRLVQLGVDGIITDYPDRIRAALTALGQPVPPAEASMARSP